LNVHHLGPCTVGLDTKDGDAVDDLVVDLINRVVEIGNRDETGENGDGRTQGRNPSHDVRFLHLGLVLKKKNQLRDD